jgi:YidC/Oxa1 family membrane protein insertase
MDKRTVVFVVVMTTAFFTVNHFLFPPNSTFKTPIAPTETTTIPPLKDQCVSDEKEVLYVLENSYQQLVISNINGAIASINLPLQSKENPKSVVKSTDIDKVLADYPEYDSFPKAPYSTPEGVVKTKTIGRYYPLLRRSDDPKYYALATLPDNNQKERIIYKVQYFDKNSIQLEGETENSTITKTYKLPSNADATPYSFDVDITIKGNQERFWLTTGIPEVEIVSGSSTQSLKYRMMKNQKEVIEEISPPKTSTTISSIRPSWIANSNGFFEIIIDPQEELPSGFSAWRIPGSSAPTRLSLIDAENNLYPVEKYPGYNMQLPLKSGTYQFHVFAGPIDTTILEKNDQVTHSNYLGTKSFHGWFAFISGPFAKFLFFLMKIFHSVVHSWGISIILLTVALRLMMYPLNGWSIKSTIKMQKLAPKIAALQEKYKKDPKKAQIEMLTIYRENGVNPLGGCFPLLIQMPFLMGMFDLLKSTFELRGTPFIPGWINNLSAPDVVFTWSMPLWFIGNSFHLLPVLLGGVMFLQQKMSSSTPKNKKLLTDKQKQQQFMGYIMTVVFTALFYNFPAGLNIYWLSSMLLGILQQWWAAKKINLTLK